MNAMKRNKISDIFPILLFMIFTLSALGIVLASAQIYQRIIRFSNDDFETETAAAYMTEKIRSHDRDGGIDTGMFCGHDAVLLEDRVVDKEYVTCIYTSDGYLRELFTEKELLNECSEDGGNAILEMDDLSVENISGRLMYLRFTDVKGNERDTYLSVQSGGGGQ